MRTLFTSVCVRTYLTQAYQKQKQESFLLLLFTVTIKPSNAGIHSDKGMPLTRYAKKYIK